MIVQIEIPEYDPRLTRYIVRHILQGAALGCRPFFVRGVSPLPPLYETNVRYQLENDYGTGVQTFRLPPDLLRRGVGDCGSLSLYEVARLQAGGEKAEVTIADWIGNNAMHAQIRHEKKPGQKKGTIEDPSVVLGAPADWPENFLYDLD